MHIFLVFKYKIRRNVNMTVTMTMTIVGWFSIAEL